MTLRIILTRESEWPDDQGRAHRSVDELAAALRAAGQRVRILDWARSSRWSTFAYAAVARADVWHATGWTDATAAAVAGTVRPGLCSVFTNSGFCERATRTRVKRAVETVVAKRIDHYVCVSDATARSYRDCHPKGREPVVIPPGIDVRRFDPSARRHPTPALLYAADAADSHANLPLLLDGLAMLRWRRPDIELWLAGPGRQGDVVAAAQPAAKDGTTLLGQLDADAMADLFGRAWVTVLPAEREPSGRVLIESLASGTPIVALDGGGPAEIVRPGLGFTSGRTAAGLADACEAAVELAQHPGVPADCRAAAWTWDWATAIVPRLLRLYHHQV